MDSGLNKSINKIVENAEKERYSLIELINYFLKSRFPNILENNSYQAFIDIARSMEISIAPDESMKNIIGLYTKKLTELNSALNEINLTEDILLSDFSIEDAQRILSLIEPALKEQNKKFINSLKRQILEGVKQQTAIYELEKRKAYLEGFLDKTRWKRGRKYEEFKRELREINEQIKKLASTTSAKTRIENTENGSGSFIEPVPNKGVEQPTKEGAIR